MDVSEFLAQKQRNREERAAVDEPEFLLSEREFDYRLRRAFAERERNVEKQVRELFAGHMAEVEQRLSQAKAEISIMISDAKAALPHALAPKQLEWKIREKIIELSARDGGCYGPSNYWSTSSQSICSSSWGR